MFNVIEREHDIDREHLAHRTKPAKTMCGLITKDWRWFDGTTFRTERRESVLICRACELAEPLLEGTAPHKWLCKGGRPPSWSAQLAHDKLCDNGYHSSELPLVLQLTPSKYTELRDAIRAQNRRTADWSGPGGTFLRADPPSTIGTNLADLEARTFAIQQAQADRINEGNPAIEMRWSGPSLQWQVHTRTPQVESVAAQVMRDELLELARRR